MPCKCVSSPTDCCSYVLLSDPIIMKLSIACVTAAVLSMPLAIMAAQPVKEDKGFWNCPLQSKCLDVTIEQVDPTVFTCVAEACEYKICLTLALSNAECSKSGAISHTCLRNPDVCLANPDGGGSCAFFGNSIETQGPVDGDTQCQIVKGGDDAIFLLKDGAGCEGSVAASVNVAGIGGQSVTGLCVPSKLSTDTACQSASSDVDSCTGNGVGKECIWTVTAPACGAVDPCAGAPSDALCCIEPVGCPTQCQGYECPAPPEPEWECEKVCKQVIPDPHTCSELPPPTRRVLKKEDKAHSSLRA
jgi:hypothetical protein